MARSRLSRRVNLFLRCATLVALLLSASAPARATDVIVRVSGIIGSAGVVRMAVCLPAEYAERHCTHGAATPSRPGTIEASVPGVPPGRYAVIAHHDRTGDGVVHTNWLGIPLDGVGVSRNATGRFGPPSFDQVALDITGSRFVVDIVLRQEPAE
jgi:uncharacterized protein (DUF2141 family)